MPENEDRVGGLPDIVRDTNRPIIIYQGLAPGQIDPVTSNALGLLAWLSILTICLVAIALSFWSIWNPAHDPSRYSPIYAEGQPKGLASRVAERRQINARAAGLIEYLERIQADNFDRRRTNETHALIEGASGVDALRREWDAACRAVRARIYDRRLGEADARLADLRRRLRQTSPGPERDQLNAGVAELAEQRRAIAEQRRTDSDPTLRCTPAAEAPVCSRASAEPWCNPDAAMPEEFADRRTT